MYIQMELKGDLNQNVSSFGSEDEPKPTDLGIPSRKMLIGQGIYMQSYSLSGLAGNHPPLQSLWQLLRILS